MSEARVFERPEGGVIIVSTLCPTSITGSYGNIKVLRKREGVRSFRLLVFDVTTPRAGIEVYRRLSRATDAFLDVDLSYLGYVLHGKDLTTKMPAGYVEVDMKERCGI